jgi:hypothetical protein
MASVASEDLERACRKEFEDKVTEKASYWGAQGQRWPRHNYQHNDHHQPQGNFAGGMGMHQPTPPTVLHPQKVAQLDSEFAEHSRVWDVLGEAEYEKAGLDAMRKDGDITEAEYKSALAELKELGIET